MGHRPSQTHTVAPNGAMTDAPAKKANPWRWALAGVGVLATLCFCVMLLMRMALSTDESQAASIAVIGTADGPTSIFMAGSFAPPNFLWVCACMAFSCATGFWLLKQGSEGTQKENKRVWWLALTALVLSVVALAIQMIALCSNLQIIDSLMKEMPEFSFAGSAFWAAGGFGLLLQLLPLGLSLAFFVMAWRQKKAAAEPLRRK